MSTTIHTHRSAVAAPAARGYEYGTTWGEQIRAAVTDYQEHFRAVGITDESVRRVAESAGEQVDAAAAHLAVEVEQMAAGAGLPAWQVMMLNARTEVLALAPPAQECSATVYWPAGGVPHTLQTWDWRPGLADEVVVHAFSASEGSTRIVAFAEFGQVGKIGVNSHGLGLHFNILHHRSDGSRPGVPVHVAARIILETATTVQEAITVARSLSYGASSVFTMASRSGELRAACVEVSPAGVAVIEGRQGAALSHTNHFLDPALAAGAKPATLGSTSPVRLDFLRASEDALAIADPLPRISALAAGSQVPICVRRDPAVPARQDSETKATITLDLQDAILGTHPGGPRDVRSQTWLTVPA